MSRAGTGSLPSLVIAVLFTTICPSVLAQRNFALPRLTSDPVQFRRMFVPQDNISELAKGMQTMRREEFDQRVLTAASRNASMLYPAGPRIVEAHYVATLEQDQMIGLDARLRIEHKESAPAFLLFEPCQMFLGAGEWEEAHQPARLGLDNRGRNIVVVEKSGWLRFAWSRRGNRDLAGDLVFNLAFPACPVNRLVVEVPTTIQPAITSGVVTKLENHSLPAANVGNEPSRWQIEFAGDPKAQLRFATVEPPTLESRGHFARYFHTYGVSEAGFDLQTKIYVDAMDQPARRLTLFVDPGLHMTSMKWDGSLLPAMPMSGTVTEPRRITIDLPVPATGANHELAITAVGTTPLGQPWRLPTVVAENLIWQQGRAEIHIPNTLALKQLDVSGGLQTAVNPLPSPWNGDSHGIQFSEPGGAVDINVARQPSRLSCRLGFSVTIGPTITQGLVVADLGSKHGQHFVITGLLPTDWSVDAVTADPASAMESWSLVGNSRQPSVRVHLRDAITPERGLRLRIAMHRRSRPTADSRSFRLFRIPDSDELERLVSVRPDPPFQLRPNGDLDVRSAAIGPNEDVNGRILLSPGGIAYRDDDRLAPFQVALSKDKPTYSADISIDLDVFAGLSRYDCSVRCEPQGATVNKVVVSFFGASTRTLHWSIGNQAQEFLAVRRLESGERDAAGYGDGDAYEVVLREPQSTPFTLHARQISPWTEPFQVPLVTVPEASRQRGGVNVRASDGSRPKISSAGLTQAPPSPARLGSYQVLRASFHYDPSQQAK